MNKRLGVEPHLSVEELGRRLRRARDGVARGQWQVIWLVARGRTCQQAAEATGYSVPWVRALVHRYNREGPDGLGDRRHGNPGQAPLLTAEQRAELARALDAGVSARGELWTGREVAAWIAERTGRPGVWAQTGWVYLRRLGFTPHRPRPHHAKADPAAQAAFKGGA
jgi:transposase